MRAIVGMDYHLDSNRLEVGKRLLRGTTELALKNQCQYIIMAGDTLSEKNGVRIDVLNLLYGELEYSLGRGVPWILERGNHCCPTKSQPENTILTLFRGVSHVINTPAIWELEDAVLFLLPWYLPEEFISKAASFARTARSYAGRLRILISHIGLDEGKASPSNMYVNQAVSLKHLEEEAYDLVILGDYHHRQWLSKKTFYGGCPISHAHGDDTNNGVWLLDTTLNTIEPVAFPAAFPKHKTWDVPDPRQSVLLGYNGADYNRIRLPTEWIPTYRTLYPDAQFIQIGMAPDRTERRLKCNPGETQNHSPETIWRKYSDLKNLQSGETALGIKILEEVAKRHWATTR
jgi:hypothetical protein